MDTREIITLCMARLKAAESATTTIKNVRKKNQQYYNCELFGDEIEGQSSFVTSDVRDTIEWMMPQLVEMFVGAEAPASFMPRSAEDVKSAEIETDYIRHVYNDQNSGFLNTYDFIKDGLLSKIGVAKVYWDEHVDEVNENYEDLDAIALQKLQLDPEIDIKAVTAHLGEGEEEQELSLEELGALDPNAAMMAKFDVECVRRSDNSQSRMVVIPPENFFVDDGLNGIDLDKAQMICHRDIVSRSDLIVDGYDKKLVDTIPSGDESDADSEKLARHADEAGVYAQSDDDQVTVYEFYIRADLTGSGKNRLHMVKLAGKGGSVLLERTEVDSQPFVAWCPLPTPHKFYGMSIAELVTDLQRLRSVLMRQMLNNLYLVNNPRKVILDGKVTKADLQNAGPGAIVRTTTLDAIRDDMTPYVGQYVLPTLSYINDMRQERTGVSPTQQGLDPSALSDSTNMVGTMIMTQALARIKMVGRIFAETGMKGVMMKLHELCSKHDRQRTFPNAQGEYQEVSPREWTARKAMTIRVGVGQADKMQRMAAISSVIQNHTAMIAAGGVDSPLLGADNVYTALVEQAKLLGFPDGAKFYRDPATYQPPPKQDIASEALQIEEARAVADVQKAAAANQIKLREHSDTIALEREKLAQEERLAVAKMQQERDLAREEMLLRYGAGK